jgi:uncharacterized Fe-S cluster-containing protein
MEDQKYKHRVFYYMKRAKEKLSREDAMAKVIKEAKEERRIMHMLNGDAGSEIISTSKGVNIESIFSARPSP